MKKRPLNSITLFAATHSKLRKVANGTGTQVATCMINKWTAKINEKEIYNGRFPPRVGGRKKERKKKRKLHFTTLNYALDYTLHPKLSDCTLCTLNYYTYHILHPNVIVAVIFNKILLHVISTCFLLRWNKVKILKYPSSKSIKTKPKIFPISLFLALTMKVWMIV